MEAGRHHKLSHGLGTSSQCRQQMSYAALVDCSLSLYLTAPTYLLHQRGSSGPPERSSDPFLASGGSLHRPYPGLEGFCSGIDHLFHTVTAIDSVYHHSTDQDFYLYHGTHHGHGSPLVMVTSRACSRPCVLTRRNNRRKVYLDLYLIAHQIRDCLFHNLEISISFHGQNVDWC